MNVPISPKKIIRVLALIVVGLSLASLAGQYYTHFLGDDTFWLKVAEKLDVNRENSLPTWYQTVSLFSCFLLLAVVAAAARAGADRYTRHWVILALVFLYLSADEFLAIHEQVGVRLSSVFPTRGAFLFAWVIPGGVFVLLFAAAYARFLLDLPARARFLFIVGGAVYVSGALGMEMTSAYFVDSYGDGLAAERTFTSAILIAIEESLEMSGIVVFINGLLSRVILPAGTSEITEPVVASGLPTAAVEPGHATQHLTARS